MPNLDPLDAAIDGLDQPAPDPLDSAVDAVAPDKSQLRQSLYGAVRQDPNDYAAATKLSRTTGLPTPIIARNLKTVQQRATIDALDAAIDSTSVLGKRMENPDFAAMAHDDVESLHTVESLLQPQPQPSKALPALRPGYGFGQASQDLRRAEDDRRDNILIGHFSRQGADETTARNILNGLKVGRAALVAQGVDAAAADFWMTQQARQPLGQITASNFDFATKAAYADASWLKRGARQGVLALENQALGLHQFAADTFGADGYSQAMQATRAENNRTLAAIGTSPQAFQRNVEGALSSIVSQTPGLVAGALTGSEAAVLAPMFFQTFGEEYANGVQNRRDYGDSVTRAAIYGTAEIVGEKFGLGDLLKGLRSAGAGVPTRELVPYFTKALAKEIPGEQLTTALEFGTDKFLPQGLTPDAALADYLQQASDTLVQTVLQSGMMLGTGVGINKVAHATGIKQQAAADAIENADKLAELAKATRASKVNARDAQTFQDFVQAASENGPIQNVFIDAQTLAQSPNVREIATAAPSVAAQLPDALATGGDVAVPLHEFTAIAGAGYARDIINHVKTEPDGMTRAEAQDFTQKQAEGVSLDDLAQMAQEPVQAAAHAAEVQAIERQITDQLNAAGRFAPAVNRAYAALPAAFFDTMAQRLGATPSALWGTYGANIGAQGITGPMLSQDSRGGFVPREFTQDGRAVVGLFKNADLSTFLHESGHWFLESYADLAKAAPQLQGDLQTVLDWFKPGLTLDQWHTMGLEEKRAHHEQFARGFETYLHTGEAPSLQLQTLFQRFRAWLASVYRNIKGLDVELSPEVRAVLDRMLATDAHIDDARRARDMAPLFATADAAAAHGVDWQQYQALGQEATGQAVATMEARSMRDMAYTSRLREETIKRLNRDATEKRKEVRTEVAAEVAKEPVYAAQRWLKRGEMTTPEGEEIKAAAGHRLSIATLRDMYPEGALGSIDWQRLGYGQYGMLAEDGLPPDLVAEMFGFQSGDAMVRNLLVAEKFNNVVEAVTDQRMLERYGDLSSPEAVARAADQAIHNDVRGRFIATELAGLQNAVGGAQALARMAKELAGRMIDNAKAGAIRPAQYAAAAVRAGKAADAALKRGDIAEAAKQKRFQLIQHAATRAAYEAQAEVQAIGARFKAIAGTTADQTRNVDLVNATRAILAEYGVGMRGKNPRAYMEAVRAYDPELFATLEPVLQDAEQNAKPLADLTVAELRALKDHVESLWYLARRERQVEIDGQLLDRQQIVATLTARLNELGVPDTAPGDGRAITENEKRIRYVQGARAAMRRVEHWVDRMDGGKINGAFRTYLWNPVSESADRYRADSAKYLARYRDLLKAVEPSLTPGKIDAPELGYTFGHAQGGMGKVELLHAILHTGNESNMRKLLLGRNWGTERADGSVDTSRWEAFIGRLANEGKLTKADFDFAQGVWDLLAEIKPLAQKTHREVFGRYFDEVTAAPVATPFGSYRGGYVPALVDTFTTQDAAVYAELDAVNQSNSYMFPATSRGFTKGRVEYNRPLLLDLRTVGSHIDKVLLFSHMEPRVRDVMRTLRAKGFAGTLNRYDPTAYTDLLLPWANRSAKQTVETPTTGWAGKLGDRFFRTMRTRAGMAAMFANMTNALQQITGLSITALKVKPSHLAAAAVRYMRSPAQMADEIAALSPFMAQRQHNETMAMRQEIEQLLVNPSAYEKAQAWTAKHGYFLQSAMQNVVDTITWSAAYDQALAAGESDVDAIRSANSAVRETQGSLSPEDVSRWETGPAFVRLFTQFQGYFNMQANILGTEFAKVAQDMGLRKGAGRLFYIYALGFMIPAVMAEAIVQAMRGGPDDDEGDGYLDEWLAAFFGSQFRTAAAGVPVIGQISVVTANAFNRKPYDDRMSTAPAVSMIESAASAPHSVYQAIVEDGSAKRAVRDTLTLVSIATGIPVSALGKPLGYAADVMQGKVEPSGPIDAARGALSGAASPGTRN